MSKHRLRYLLRAAGLAMLAAASIAVVTPTADADQSRQVGGAARPACDWSIKGPGSS